MNVLIRHRQVKLKKRESIREISPLRVGFARAPCGIVIAGGMAISMKYGTSDPYEGMKVLDTGLKARDFYYWFKEEFESCDCIDLSFVEDWGDADARDEYYVVRKSFCSEIMGKTARKLVDILTVDNPKVVR